MVNYADAQSRVLEDMGPNASELAKIALQQSLQVFNAIMQELIIQLQKTIQNLIM